MNKVALITGGGSGIGQALAWQLAQKGLRVFVVGRRLEKLQFTALRFPNSISFIQADVGTPKGRAQILAALSQIQVDYLIHNAAIVEPLALMGELSLNSWREAMAVNLEGPLFLTQSLLPHLKAGSRILNISSGLAHRALKGSLAYCVSKAASHMVYLSFNQELNEKGIYAGSVMPGVVDTEMQAYLRAQDKNRFPEVGRFRSFKDEGLLRSSEEVAVLLAGFLQQATNEDFSKKDWDIEELAQMLEG